jgi:branched-chain amino acid transport system ATP-binding protein
MTAILETKGVTKRFGGLTAVDNVDITVERGTIHGLIGPNGAGKSTLLNLINGVYPVTSGRISLFGKDTTKFALDEVARLGVARTFQNVGLFPGLTVLENARSGGSRFSLRGIKGALFGGGEGQTSEQTTLREAWEALDRVGLRGMAQSLAGSLPYGSQRFLELARASLMHPELILLDEPVAGLPPPEVKTFAKLVLEMKRNGATILLVDHNMTFTMAICDRLTVLNFGRKIAEGTPQEIQKNPEVMEAYLGSSSLAERQEKRSGNCQDGPTLLELENVTAAYGEIPAIKDISLKVQRGEMVAILGANGAGKSTTLRAISGLFPRLKGVIKFEGKEIHKLQPHRVASLGIAHVPEGRKIFPGLTVYENLEIASTAAPRQGYDFRKTLSEIYDLFPALKERSAQLGWSLSGGEQQMLAIARGLISKPKILILDEPSLGIAPKLVESIFAWIEKIHQQGTTILLVEQNAQLALATVDRAYVLAEGRVVQAGTAAELMETDVIREAYLGGAIEGQLGEAGNGKIQNVN